MLAVVREIIGVDVLPFRVRGEGFMCILFPALLSQTVYKRSCAFGPMHLQASTFENNSRRGRHRCCI